MIGFYIKRLIVKGNNLANASISFKIGANLVTGASDTGKSYIFSAIAYLLGSSEQPKEIEESKGYSDLYLEISSYADNKIYTLFRKVGRNQIEVKETDIETFFTSSSGHRRLTTTGGVDNTDHISFFLLSLCNLNDKKLLQNRNNGITHNLSFDNLRKLTFVDEERIIKTASPFYYSSQFINQTKGQSLLNLLMTSEDYSNVIAKEDKNIKETRINGKLEFLSYQISQFASDKDEAVAKLSKNTTNDVERFASLDQELQANLNEAREITRQKNTMYEVRKKLTDDLFYKRELLQRFNVLKKQYETDAERLDFILETSVLASQLGDTVCPICSQPLDRDHQIHIAENESFREAASEELKKNQSKLAGLQDTITALKAEEIDVQKSLIETDATIERLETKLKENFSPKIQDLKSHLRDFLDVEKAVNQIAFADNQIKKLYVEKDRLEKLLHTKEKQEELTILPYSLLSELCLRIENRLKKWNYEQHVKVDFDSSYRVFDIVISGKNRRSYGKGKRSISYAACLFGLLDFSSEKQLPFSNLLVMDSPLTTFEEKKKQVKDTNEILTTQVLKSFFLDFGNLPVNSQVIIFDNKEPDDSTSIAIQEKVFIQVFTGTDEGRFGFFPLR